MLMNMFVLRSDAIENLSFITTGSASMLNISDRGVIVRDDKEHGSRGGSGKKSSTATKIILKEATKPHHNLTERVAQVNANQRSNRDSFSFCHKFDPGMSFL